MIDMVHWLLAKITQQNCSTCDVLSGYRAHDEDKDQDQQFRLLVVLQ